MNKFHHSSDGSGAEDASGSRQQRADQTRSRILAAAVEIIDERGEAALRVVDVASQAGVAPGSIYNHFADRDELVIAARLVQFLESVGDDVAGIGLIVSAAEDPDAMVRHMREASRVASSADRADRRWLRAEVLGAARRRPILAAALGGEQHVVNRELARIAALGQQRGLIDPALDPMAVAIFVQAFTFGLLLADIDTETDLDPEAWLDVVSRFTAAITPPRDPQGDGTPSTVARRSKRGVPHPDAGS